MIIIELKVRKDIKHFNASILHCHLGTTHPNDLTVNIKNKARVVAQVTIGVVISHQSSNHSQNPI